MVGRMDVPARGLVLVEDDLALRRIRIRCTSGDLHFAHFQFVAGGHLHPESAAFGAGARSARRARRSCRSRGTSRRPAGARFPAARLRRACRARRRRSRIRAPQARRGSTRRRRRRPASPATRLPCAPPRRRCRRCSRSATFHATVGSSSATSGAARRSSDDAARRNARRSWPSAKRRGDRRAFREPEQARRTGRRPRPPSHASLRRSVPPSTPIGRRRLAIVSMFNPAATPELAFRRPKDPTLPAGSFVIRSDEKSLIFGNIGNCAAGARKPDPPSHGRGRSVKLKAPTGRPGGAGRGLKRGASQD